MTYSPIYTGPAERGIGRQALDQDVRDAVKCVGCMVIACLMGLGGAYVLLACI